MAQYVFWSYTRCERCSLPPLTPGRVPFPGLYRRNNVAAWQRLHQQHDGLRSWQKVRYMIAMNQHCIGLTGWIGASG